MHTHFGYRIVGPSNEVLRKQLERQAEQPHKQPRRGVRLVLDLHPHEIGIASVELNRLGQIDDLHRSPSRSTMRLVRLAMRSNPISITSPAASSRPVSRPLPPGKVPEPKNSPGCRRSQRDAWASASPNDQRGSAGVGSAISLALIFTKPLSDCQVVRTSFDVVR